MNQTVYRVCYSAGYLVGETLNALMPARYHVLLPLLESVGVVRNMRLESAIGDALLDHQPWTAGATEQSLQVWCCCGRNRPFDDFAQWRAHATCEVADAVRSAK